VVVMQYIQRCESEGLANQNPVPSAERDQHPVPSAEGDYAPPATGTP
jgi:hypothetical protein